MLFLSRMAKSNRRVKNAAQAIKQTASGVFRREQERLA
jgi:hypothetical protein